MPLIAPALLSADFACLAEALEMVKAAGATMVHLDVMDGHFAPDIAMGRPVFASIRRATDLALDAHLLIERPERFVAEFAAAGADQISVHVEATPQLHRALELIHRQGVKAGVALNPASPLHSVTEVMGEIDSLTILTAEVEISEMTSPASEFEKVRAARQARDQRGLSFRLQVEGGLGFENLEEVIRAGADILVVGSAIFESSDPKARLGELIRLAAGARQTTKV